MDRCRVCLDASESKMYPLEGCIVNCEVSISEMITYCTSLGIDPNDGWPTSVCIPCFRTVRIAYNFIRQYKETYEGSLDGAMQLQVSQEVTLKDETVSITEDQVDSLEEEDHIPQVEACGKEQVYYEYEQEVSDGNELEAGVEEGSKSLQQDDCIYYDNDRNLNGVLDEDITQDHIDYFQQSQENEYSPQEDTENCAIEEFMFPKQDSEECEIEYEVLDAENRNGALQDTMDEDIVYELSNTPKQRVIKVISRQNPSARNQSTKLRRKIRTRISCPLCPNVFFSSYERELVPHMMRHEEQGFSCNVCNTDLVFNSQKFLNHFHEMHRYQCPFCGKSFTRKQNLSSHMKEHSGATYKCSFEGCNKTFPAAWNLKKHQTTHSGKVTHICQECGMEFKTYDTYRYHRKKHLGRKFLCTHCGQAFMQSVHLKYHMWTHTGIKNFKCDLCEKSYTSVTQLKKHRRRHHPKAKEFIKYEEIVEGT